MMRKPTRLGQFDPAMVSIRTRPSILLIEEDEEELHKIVPRLVWSTSTVLVLPWPRQCVVVVVDGVPRR